MFLLVFMLGVWGCHRLHASCILHHAAVGVSEGPVRTHVRVVCKTDTQPGRKSYIVTPSGHPSSDIDVRAQQDGRTTWQRKHNPQ
jgi:hypothetical protein